MNIEKTRYAKEELNEFETLINQKLEKAFADLKDLQEIMKEENRSLSNINIKTGDDSAEVQQVQNLQQLISRQSKFIQHLEAALQRIHQGTYGICATTGKLIAKERLRVVPHTTHSLAAKQNRPKA